MMQKVRTTVTLDQDAEQIVRRRMREGGLSFDNDFSRFPGVSWSLPPG